MMLTLSGLGAASGGKKGQGVTAGPGGQKPYKDTPAGIAAKKAVSKYTAIPINKDVFATSPEVKAAVNALPPNVNPNITDYQPFRKGDALSVDVPMGRVDAGTGEGAYNPADPMFKLHNQVRQAYQGLQRRYASQGMPQPSGEVVSVVPTALTTTGGGGGGGGGGGSDTPADAPTSWWGGLSTIAKVGIIGGGAAVVGFAIYKLAKGGGGGAAPSSKSRY